MIEFAPGPNNETPFDIIDHTSSNILKEAMCMMPTCHESEGLIWLNMTYNNAAHYMYQPQFNYTSDDLLYDISMIANSTHDSIIVMGTPHQDTFHVSDMMHYDDGSPAYVKDTYIRFRVHLRPYSPLRDCLRILKEGHIYHYLITTPTFQKSWIKT